VRVGWIPSTDDILSYNAPVDGFKNIFGMSTEEKKRPPRYP